MNFKSLSLSLLSILVIGNFAHAKETDVPIDVPNSVNNEKQSLASSSIASYFQRINKLVYLDKLSKASSQLEPLNFNVSQSVYIRDKTSWVDTVSNNTEVLVAPPKEVSQVYLTLHDSLLDQRFQVYQRSAALESSLENVQINPILEQPTEEKSSLLQQQESQRLQNLEIYSIENIDNNISVTENIFSNSPFISFISLNLSSIQLVSSKTENVFSQDFVPNLPKKSTQKIKNLNAKNLNFLETELNTFSLEKVVIEPSSSSSTDSPLETTPLEVPPQNSTVINELQNPQHSTVGSLYVTFSPITWHLDDMNKSKVNDFPLGLGLAYDFDIIRSDSVFLNNTLMSAEFSIFKDSDFGYPSGFLATTFRKNIIDELQLGFGAGLVYTTQLKRLSGSPILPFIFPFMQTDFKFPLNLRVVYIPSVSDFKSQQIFFTVFIKVN